jgi:hypothetical protein
MAGIETLCSFMTVPAGGSLSFDQDCEWNAFVVFQYLLVLNDVFKPVEINRILSD